MNLTSVLAGAAGGIVSWFVTDFIGRPVSGFFRLRTEIDQCIRFYGNVRAPVSERGKVTEDFTAEDLDRLQEAQAALRQLAMKMQSFAATERMAHTLVKALRYDPWTAGKSLVGYSNSIARYGDERVQHLNKVYA